MEGEESQPIADHNVVVVLVACFCDACPDCRFVVGDTVAIVSADRRLRRRRCCRRRRRDCGRCSLDTLLHAGPTRSRRTGSSRETTTPFAVDSLKLSPHCISSRV